MGKTKTRSIFICQNCGAQRSRWEGRCPECEAWNSFVEEVQNLSTDSQRGWMVGSGQSKAITYSLNQPLIQDEVLRVSTSFKELDRVLGGGVVPGSFILLGGDPGIGKSTLLLQMAGGLAKEKLLLLYISAEESVAQTALRAHRLHIHHSNIEVGSESQIEKILDLIESKKPHVLIVDSIQTVYLSELGQAPGSVSQVRECANRLMAFAKNKKITIFIIGHVTKEGSLAGPKVLEHMVDTVLSFEGEPGHTFRLLRSLKNRFGPTQELGVFQMTTEGLEEVENPSEIFLQERGVGVTGSAIYAAIEGTRPLLCEVQALTSSTHLAMPRRTCLGIDLNRLHLLIAVLEKNANINLSHRDVFVNIVGGLKISEPAADLAIASALISTEKRFPLPQNTCFFGEVGLTGEVRAVTQADLRVKEAIRLGFTTFILPESNKKNKELLQFKEAQFFWIQKISDLVEFFRD